MTHAVVELATDVGETLPHLSKVIPNCAYDANWHSLGFRLQDMSVIVDRRKVAIENVVDEDRVRFVMAWLREKALEKDAA